ncbi:MAG: PaaI family thioesterase [Candidatus Heimdallarchaeota archaeon]|nr:PaaI family thioesterase [Candidatus Heimdallarchaeota archaeon]
MERNSHYKKLEKMYLEHNLNAVFKAQIKISDKEAEIKIPIGEHLFHAANATHGAVYFKALDDVAFFAANSIVEDVFLLTTSFTIYLTKPIAEGTLVARGKLVNFNRRQYIAEGILYNSSGDEIGRGSGVYVPSKIKLIENMGYK